MSANLRAYSALNNLPQDLKDTMQEHLRLSFSSSDASDDQVGSLTVKRLVWFCVCAGHVYLCVYVCVCVCLCGCLCACVLPSTCPCFVSKWW
jgi:hypothetical protein